MGVLELAAVVLSVAYVVLASREIIYCWIAALISVSIYFYMCWTANLQAEAGLQIYYFVMAVYGWQQWEKRKEKEALAVSEWGWPVHAGVIVFGIACIAVLSGTLLRFTNASMPVIDSFTTVFSVIGTYMTAKKIKSTWIYFIVVDLVSVYMYYQKGFSLTAGLFVAYTAVAAYAYWEWNKSYENNRFGKEGERL
ncbi:MAG: nicotinamide riboside transporter PnuC [Cytophagales bacterium]|nr:nicotinamide riboside transporter PnuC [Cytophagales bacterium]